MDLRVRRLFVLVSCYLSLIAPLFGQPGTLEPPGSLIEVNGRLLHLYCEGEGNPTVVYEAGFGGWSVDWEKVQPIVAATTRSCSYDRAGLGWSEPSDVDMTTSQDIAEDLHELLSEAGEEAPYLMVAHSIGGLHLRIFANLYPDEVVGAVLVDSSHEGMFVWEPTTYWDTPAPETPEQPACALAEPDRTPEAAETVRVLQEQPKVAETGNRESSGLPASGSLLREIDSLPNIPLIVLTAGAERELEGHWTPSELAWNRSQRHLASLSPRSTQVHVPGACHYIQLDRPDVVVASILRIVAIARDSVKVQ